MTTRAVVCLGDVMVDVVARLPHDLAPGSDTPAPVTMLGGGSAPNTAAWLAFAGVPVTFVGRVGDDAAGRWARAELRAAGVELEVSVDPVRPTGICVVLVDAAGERTMVPSAGANAGLGDMPLPDRLRAGQLGLHVSGYAFFTEGARPAAERAIRAVTRAGGEISVDAASAAPLRAFGATAFLDRVGYALLFANRAEAEVLTGHADPAVAALALGARCGEAVVKCGADGAVWSDGARTVHAAAVPVAAAEVVDSTGAGDAFAAGVLAARAAGRSVSATLTAGANLAARAVGRVGARPPRQDAR
jgi:ribokinase